MVSFAQRLSSLRDAKNISRVDLASALGLPRTSIEKFETGRLTPSKEQSRKMAAYFGVSEAYLRGESDDPENGSSGWLSGNLPEEPQPEIRRAPQPVRPKVVAVSDAHEKEDSAMFQLLLKSDTFRAAVLEVLRSPEGQKLMEQAARRELRNR